jgi:hypothetical protein
MATTKPHKLSLTPQKELAITLLLAGKTDQEAAIAAGVARETICRWRSRCPFFEAEFNRRRREIWESQKIRLHALVGDAITTIAEAVKTDASIAMKILQICKDLIVVEPSFGPDEVGAILHRMARRLAEDELATTRGAECDVKLRFLDPFQNEVELAPLIRKHFSALKGKYGEL